MPITDSNEQYFKDGGWSWNGSIWIKGGLAFEYAEQVLGRDVNLDADAGTNFLYSTAVPANYIWIITAMEVSDDTSGVSFCKLGVLVGETWYWLAASGSLGAGVGFSWAGNVYLVADDKLQIVFSGATAGDVLYFAYAGYAMRLT